MAPSPTTALTPLEALQPAPVATLAQRLGVSEEAVALCREAVLIDLHIDTFIPPRLWGYDPLARHRGGPLGRHFFGHLDLPRMVDGGLDGAMWSITTNPFRTRAGRWRAFQRNWAGFQRLVARSRGRLELVTSRAGFEEARLRGAHAVFLSVQGANAFDGAPEGMLSAPEPLLRATLVHLTSSTLGCTNSPHAHLTANKGLTPLGRAFVEQMNARRIFVDLAHIHPVAFREAAEVHDRSQPLLATHTGVDGVRPHWRNLSDADIRTVADTGGVVGIIFATQFLRRRGGPASAAMIVEHMEHVMAAGGEEVVAVGSDYDGAISPPADLWGGETYPRLVQHMLDRGWSEARIRGALGLNFLAALDRLRPPGSLAPAEAAPRG